MADELRSGFVGLVTNLPHSAAPPGALLKADNVVIRKPGVVEPRPGSVAVSVHADVAKIATSFSFDGANYWYVDTGANAGLFQGSASTRLTYTSIDGSASYVLAANTGRKYGLQTALSDDRILLCTAYGVLGVHKDQADWTDHAPLGVPRLAVIYTAAVDTTSTWLPTGYQVAYRLVTKRTWSSGRISRSAPSGRVVVQNTAGADRGVSFGVRAVRATSQSPDEFDFNGNYNDAFVDSIEVYRTGNFLNTVEIDEEYALVAELKASDFSDATTTYITSPSPFTVSDTVSPSDRGAALYTSPSREGALGANEMPPVAQFVETYNGRVFLGHTVSPYRKKLSFNWSGSIGAGSATGIGYRSFATTLTNGSAIATMADTTGLKAGMVCRFRSHTNSSFSNAIPVTIDSVDSGTQITLSDAYTGVTGASTVDYFDTIYLDGHIPIALGSHGTATFDANDSEEPLLELPAIYTDSTAAERVNVRSESVRVYRVTPPEAGYTHTFVFETRNLFATSSTLDIKATHGDEFFPPVAALTADPVNDAGTALDRDVYPHGIAWSKRDEPDHFTLAAYAFVGASSKQLLGMKATRDSLFIFKEDGIWRLSGQNDPFRIDAFDLTTFVVHPASIQRLNNKIYALTNKGVVRVSESGVEVVSLPIHDEIKRLVKAYQDEYVANTDFQLGDEWSLACVNPVEHEYMLLVGSTMPTIRNVLVYNERTQAWTTWSYPSPNGQNLTLCSLGWSEVNNSVLVGCNASALRVATASDTLSVSGTSYTNRCDTTSSITVSSVSGTTMQYTGGNTPNVGDIIRVGTSTAVVATVTSTGATRAVTTTESAPVSTGAGTLYASVSCTVRPHPFSRDPRTHKHWGYVSLGFQELIGAAYARVDFWSSGRVQAAEAYNNVTQPVSLDTGTLTFADYRSGCLLRAIVPRRSARAWKLFTELLWRQAWGDAQLELISTVGVEAGPNRPGLAATGAQS